jgi:hypothetical protein
MAATGDGDSDVNLHRAAVASDDVEQSHEQQECKVLSFLWEVEVVEGENGGEREGAERMPMLISSEVGFTVVDWARSRARGRFLERSWRQEREGSGRLGDVASCCDVFDKMPVICRAHVRAG